MVGEVLDVMKELAHTGMTMVVVTHEMVIDLADNDSKIRWATDICAVFDKYGIGRAYWNYKEKDYGIVDIPDESVQRELAAKL